MQTRMRSAFEAMAAGRRGEPRDLAHGLQKELTGIGLRTLAARTLAAAVSSPELLAPLYDGLAEGWRGQPLLAESLARKSPPPPLPLERTFWTAFWGMMDRHVEARTNTARFVEQTAYISTLAPAGLQERVAGVALMFPAARGASSRAAPPVFDLKALDAAPAGSLAAGLRRTVAARGDRIELLDRAAWRLDNLPAPLPYLNIRALQCHDLWRLVLGCDDTLLHRMAMAAFQMGHFGHNYSALMLAMVFTELAFLRPPWTQDVLDTVLLAYVHGRETPSLLDVDWPAIWSRPVEEVRALLGITPMGVRAPSDAIEQRLAATAAAG